MKIKHWLTALCALTMALMWAIISKKQAKKEAAA